MLKDKSVFDLNQKLFSRLTPEEAAIISGGQIIGEPGVVLPAFPVLNGTSSISTLSGFSPEEVAAALEMKNSCESEPGFFVTKDGGCCLNGDPNTEQCAKPYNALAGELWGRW